MTCNFLDRNVDVHDITFLRILLSHRSETPPISFCCDETGNQIEVSLTHAGC